MTYDGLLTVLTSAGAVLQNSSYPYYGDTTWGYGLRTQISGTMQFNATTGAGTATVNPFEFYDGGYAIMSNFALQSIGGGLMLGNMTFNWGGSEVPTQIVLNGSGLIAEMGTVAISDTYDAAACAISGACALPASNGINSGNFPIGPVPIATTSFNTTGQAGPGTTLGMLSLGTDDGIGGSPMDNGPFADFNFNFDMTSVTVTGVTAVPVPAAVWLFGSGLLGLIGVARSRKR